MVVIVSGCASTGAERWCLQGSIDCKYWEYSDCEKAEGQSALKEWMKISNQSMKDRSDCEKAFDNTKMFRTKKELKAFESCMKSKGYVKFKKSEIDVGKIYLQTVMFPVEILRLLSHTYYDHKGSVIISSSSPSEWIFIVPDSINDGLYEKVCR